MCAISNKAALSALFNCAGVKCFFLHRHFQEGQVAEFNFVVMFASVIAGWETTVIQMP